MKTNRREVIKGTLAVAARSAALTSGLGSATSLTSCGGGGGSAASTPAPSGLWYATPLSAIVGTAINDLSPTVNGVVSSFAVTPALPAGLSLSPAAGVISGTPTGASPQAVYIVTASNSAGTSTFALSITVVSPLAITGLSNATPQALTALAITTLGLDITQAYTVTLASTGVSGTVNLRPLRTGSDGSVIVAMPITLDGGTGATRGFDGQLTITQNGTTTAPIDVSIADLPQLSDMGASLGSISRAFYIHQELTTAGNLNAQQALAALPNVTVKASGVIADQELQLKNVITARNDVDRIVTDHSTSIAAGTAADGTPLSFTSTSLEIQDRIIGQYLLTCTSNGTVIPAKLGSRRARRKRPSRSTPRPSDKAGIPPNAITQITQVISAGSGWVGFKTAQQTLAQSDSSAVDHFLASASEYQTVAVLGTTVVALGAAVVGAPAVAALAGAALTYETLLGVAIGAASIGNDLYNVVNTGYDAYQASGADAALNSRFSSAVLALGTDAFSTAISAVGVGAFASGSVVGNAAESVFQSLWGSVSAADATLGAAALAASTGSLYLQNALTADGAATQNGLDQMAALTASPQTGFGTVTGTSAVANSQGPILSGLTGIEIGDGTSTFSAIADPSGAYDVLVPLGNASINYSQATLSAYDPISGLILSSEPIDLSSLTSDTVDAAAPLVGACTDDDASTPDADDPDCD